MKSFTAWNEFIVNHCAQNPQETLKWKFMVLKGMFIILPDKAFEKKEYYADF